MLDFLRRLRRPRRRHGRILLLASVLALLVAAGCRLNDPLVSGGDVSSFVLSPDGSRVAYIADQDTNDVFQPYTVLITGGTVAGLTPAFFLLAGDASSITISPDSGRVVYLADFATDETFELYSAPIGGGLATKLNSPLVANGNVFGIWRISPDSTRVIYLADQDTDNVVELYSAPIDQSAAETKLHAGLSGGKDVSFGTFEISPNSSRVVLVGDLNDDDVFEVFSVPIEGGAAPVVLNGPLTPGGDVNTGSSARPRISSNSGRVVYTADQRVNDQIELFSAPIGGGIEPVTLNHTLELTGDVSAFQISEDASRVIYLARQSSGSPLELWSVPLGGGTATKISGTLVPGGSLNLGTGGFQISPDSGRVVYRADQDTDEVSELFSVPIGGGPVVKLNGLLPTFGGVTTDWYISPDSKWVVYVADQETNNVFELYAAPIDGSAPALKLSPSLVTGGNVGGDFSNVPFVWISPDSNRVAYLADQDTNDVVEIYSAPIFGGPVSKLNLALVSGGDVVGAGISADSRIVVYWADGAFDEQRELFWATLQKFAYGPISYRSNVGPGS